MANPLQDPKDDSNPLLDKSLPGLLQRIFAMPQGYRPVAGALGQFLPMGVKDAPNGGLTPTWAMPPVLSSNPLAPITNAVSMYRDAALGQGIPSDAVQKSTDAALALGSMGVGVPKPANSMGTFGGARAAEAPTSTLSSAMTMASRGEDPQYIWSMTGWHKSTDGKWKFEIDDTKSNLMLSPDPRGRVSINYGADSKLSDVFDHPELYKQYPELKDYSIKPLGFGDVINGVKGSFNYKTRTIRMGSDSPDEFKSTLLHEIQHGIQDREGFALGGSPDQFLPRDFGARYTYAKDTIDELGTHIRSLTAIDPDTNQPRPVNFYSLLSGIKKLDEGKRINKFEQAHIDAVNTADSNLIPAVRQAVAALEPLNKAKDQAYENYRMLGGEVEARNVQNTLQNPAEMRFVPNRRLGYPVGQQIINFEHQTEPVGSVSPSGNFTTTPGTIANEHNQELLTIIRQATENALAKTRGPKK